MDRSVGTAVLFDEISMVDAGIRVEQVDGGRTRATCPLLEIEVEHCSEGEAIRRCLDRRARTLRELLKEAESEVWQEVSIDAWKPLTEEAEQRDREHDMRLARAEALAPAKLAKQEERRRANVIQAKKAQSVRVTGTADGWRPVPRFGNYEINEDGVVRHARLKKPRSLSRVGNAYFCQLKAADGYQTTVNIPKLLATLFGDEARERFLARMKEVSE